MKEVQTIEKKVTFQAPIEKVWNAVSNSEAIEEWFMPNNFEAKEGFKFEIQSPFGPSVCEVLTIDPPKHLSFSWGEMGWIISFYLIDLGDSTEFTLTHSGWGKFDELIPETGETHGLVRDRMDNGWNKIVYEDLKKVAEK
ncbi:hypothetical protein CR203_15835 [Salipaludibacillus neizhouensis]|uniref:Activator of Hsp90 ATPase homologue 1/2-like C-terminal domain-containing protein n=1 Tax=Salipaludibacillus neizhouensis TaxID=885475 RepID=A0A3A9K1Y3_9BACI|nr:SRPBCC domain-containing protein [Salipaludibacillus neizhouensis]RKL66359.1 hypothetical protein CR203_15835 [Salipaludibacillus neizhouensis]